MQLHPILHAAAMQPLRRLSHATPTCSAPLLTHNVVGVVAVGAVVLTVPLGGDWAVLGGPPLGLGLVVDHVESHDLWGGQQGGKRACSRG